MGIKAIVGLLLAGILVACSIPLGMTSTQRTSLVLKFDGLPAQTPHSGSGRLVSPDTSAITLIVKRSTGETLQEATVNWDAVTGSASVALKGIPLHQPLVFEAQARTAPDNQGVTLLTARGNATTTLVEGANVVPIFLFPEVAAANELAFGFSLAEQSYVSGEWNLWKFVVPAAPAAFAVTFPEGATAYLQAPSGPVTPLYLSGTSVASEPGTWNILVWNRGAGTTSGEFSTAAKTAPDYGYILNRIKFPDLGGEGPEVEMSLEVRLYDRPYSRDDKVLLFSQPFFVAQGQTDIPLIDLPSWQVKPQQSLVFVMLAAGAVVESAEVLLETPFTSPGQTVTLYTYSGESPDEGGVVAVPTNPVVIPTETEPTPDPNEESDYFVGRTTPAEAPTGLEIDEEGVAHWDPLTAFGFSLSIQNPAGAPNYTTGDLFLEGAVTSFALTGNAGGVVFNYLPTTGTSTYRIRAYFQTDSGLFYAGPLSEGVSLVAPPDETAPVVSIVHPDGSKYTVEKISVDGSASDNITFGSVNNALPTWPVYRYKVGLEEGTWTTWAPVEFFNGNNWSFTLSGIQSADQTGYYTVEVKTQDLAGNLSGVATASFDLQEDIQNPTTTIYYSAPAYAGGSVWLSGDSADNVFEGVYVELDTGTGWFSIPSGYGPWNYSLDLSTATAGQNFTVYARAVDANGNVTSEPQYVSFTAESNPMPPEGP